MTTGIKAPRGPNLPPGYTGGATITPHDTNELPIYARAIWVGATAGTITLVTINGDTLVAAGAAGQIIPVEAKIVKSTGTTATPLTALW